MSGAHEEFFEKFKVPAGLTTFAFDTPFLGVSFDKRLSRPAHQAKVLCRGSLGSPVGVLAKANIHLPVQVVFDPPMFPKRDPIIAGAFLLAADKVTHVAFGLAVDRTFRDTHADGPQVGPSVFIANDGKIVDHFAITLLFATVSVNRLGLIVVMGDVLEVVFMSAYKGLLNVLEQVRLIVFDRQHIVATALANLGRDLLLATHGIDRDHGPLGLQ